MIIKCKKGYYVISEKIKHNLGGPYKSRQQALKRLRQIEFFKHQKQLIPRKTPHEAGILESSLSTRTV